MVQQYVPIFAVCANPTRLHKILANCYQDVPIYVHNPSIGNPLANLAAALNGSPSSTLRSAGVFFHRAGVVQITISFSLSTGVRPGIER